MLEPLKLDKVWDTINAWWARSMITILFFLVGWVIGNVQTEGRIASDCKFANAFRVDIQAFSCQRKL